MKAEHHPGDSTITCQGIDVAKKSVLKVVTHSGGLTLVKFTTLLQIPEG
jgi:hypothetical protein